MTLADQIDQLEHDGFHVQIQHLRYYDAKGRVLGKGGQTVVTIVDPFIGEVVARGVARCNPEDNYDRRRGATIALGRATKAGGLW